MEDYRINMTLANITISPTSGTITVGRTIQLSATCDDGVFDVVTITLNAAEVNAIKTKISNNQDPWKSSYNKVITNANAQLSITPPSVIPGTINSRTNDAHDFYAEPVYCLWTSCGERTPAHPPYGRSVPGVCCDGWTNPTADQTDNLNADIFRKALNRLRLAYLFSGNVTYANKIITLIRTWCLNSDTKMNPRYPPVPVGIPVNQSEYFIPRLMASAACAAGTIWYYSGFQPYKSEFKTWLKTLITASHDFDSNQNKGTWRDVGIITSAALLYNDADTRAWAQDEINFIIDSFKTKCYNSFTVGTTTYPAKFDTNGSLPHERNRTSGFLYSMFDLVGEMIIAEVAYHFGTNLYTYTANNRSLGKVLDFHAPYIINATAGWPYLKSGTYTGQLAGIYELAFTRYNSKPLYKQTVLKWFRNNLEYFLLENVTLTHGSSFD